jgi:hypothetical protein
LTSGSGGGCAPSPGNSGSMDALALPSCDAAASAGIWQQRLPEAPMALGGSQSVPRSTSPCRPASSDHSDYVPSQIPLPHNPANRRIRTRTSGGVGGEEPQGSPLSRLGLAPLTGSSAMKPSRSEKNARYAMQIIPLAMAPVKPPDTYSFPITLP